MRAGCRGPRAACRRARDERGQALLLLLGVIGAVLVGTLVLVALGQALGGKSRHQRAADLAAVSAAHRMSDDYFRLFEPAVLPNGLPNPRHMTTVQYLLRARSTAVRAAARNDVRLGLADVTFPGGGYAPTRVRVRARGEVGVRVEGGHRRERAVEVEARATAELAVLGVGGGMPEMATGGGYSGPLAYRQGKPMRPDVALAFDRMAAAARADGVALIVVSGFRTDAEQARLFAAHPDPEVGRAARQVAAPARHRARPRPERRVRLAGGERPALRLPPAVLVGALALRLHRQRRLAPRSATARRSATAARRVPAFVPRRFAGDHRARVPALERRRRRPVRPALRRVELQPVRPLAGRRPGHRSVHARHGRVLRPLQPLRSRGRDRRPGPPDARPAAPVRLRPARARRLQRRPRPRRRRCGCIPDYPETQAYVAKILGLLNGAGDLTGSAFEVRLVE